MISLEHIKDYFSELRRYDRRNIMLPVVIGVLALLVFIKHRARGY